jgi:hypothetical protein
MVICNLAAYYFCAFFLSGEEWPLGNPHLGNHVMLCNMVSSWPMMAIIAAEVLSISSNCNWWKLEST